MGSSKPLVWLHGEVRTPPFSSRGRREAGFLLRLRQLGERLSLPHSRPMRSIDDACHELRLRDSGLSWRIIYALEEDAVVILDVFAKKTGKTPKSIVEASRQRLRRYREA